MQENILEGRIANLSIFSVPEFGVRASFTIEHHGRQPAACCIAGNVAREFIAQHCDGDLVAVTGYQEARPSTCATNTPWAGRFRVCSFRMADAFRLAA